MAKTRAVVRTFETHIPTTGTTEDTQNLINSQAYTDKLNYYRNYGYDFNTVGRGATLMGNAIYEVYPKAAEKNHLGVNNQWVKLAQSIGTTTY